MSLTGTPNWALTVKTTVPNPCTPPFRKSSAVGCVKGWKSPNIIGAIMTATLNKTPILFAALLTVATPVFAGGWRTIPDGVGTDGVCTLYNQNLECVDAARNFLASSANDGTIQMRVVNVSSNDVLNIRGYPSSESRIAYSPSP